MPSLPGRKTRSKTPRRGSAPARLAASPNPKYRRTRSASPGVRNWKGPRRASPRRSSRSAPRPSKLMRMLVAGLSLGAIGRGNTPLNKQHFRKSLVPYPYGSSGYGRNLPLSKTYYPGSLSTVSVVERTRAPKRPFTGGRKMFPGRHAPVKWYAPEVHRENPPRKFGIGRKSRVSVVYPVTNARGIQALNLAGFKLPASTLNQARKGKPIVGNTKGPMIVLEKLRKLEKKLLSLPKK